MDTVLYRVSGDDQEEGRWSWTLKLARRDHEQGGGKLDFFRFGLFLNSSATDIVLLTLPSTAVETAIARCTSRWAMARDTALTLPLFWRRSTVSPVFFGRCPRSSVHSFVLHPPSVPVPNKQPHFYGRKAKWSHCLVTLSLTIMKH